MRFAMHAFQCFFLTVAIAPDGAFAEDSVHLVVIEAATSDVGSIRAQLLDPANISKPDAIDPLRKRKGITVHGDFRRALKWGLRVERFTEPTGIMKNSDGREFGAWLKFHPGKHGTSVFDVVEGGLNLGRGDSYRGLSVGNSQMATIPARWVERSCWGDEKVSRMLWQYSEVDGFEEIAKAPPDATFKSLHVQMLWLRAEPDESTKLNAADQETRAKAIEWLRSRGKVWRECGFWNRADQSTQWADVHRKWKRSDQGSLEEADGEALSIDGGFTGADEKLEIKWKAWAISRGKYSDLGEFEAKSKSGDWIFLPVKDFAAANLVACRLSKN